MKGPDKKRGIKIKAYISKVHEQKLKWTLWKYRDQNEPKLKVEKPK